MVLKNKRLQRVRRLMAENKVPLLIVDAPIDLFYLTGKKLSLGKLLVTQRGAFLFVDGRYFEGCKDLKEIEPILSSSFGKESPFAKKITKLAGRIGFDSHSTTYESYLSYSAFVEKKRLFPLRRPIAQVRAIKESDEVAKLKSAAALNVKGMAFLKRRIREGVSEAELARALELFWMKEGGEGVSFEPIIAFGENSALPHHRASSRILKRGDTVLLDIGVKKEGYIADMTRTYFFGEPHKKMKEIFKVVKEAQKSALKALRPGMLAGELDQAARSVIEEAGYGELFTHSLGHGIGLEVHELPFLRKSKPDADTILEEGMAITIEPGIYLPKIGGVRLEESLIITDKGYEVLAHFPT